MARNRGGGTRRHGRGTIAGLLVLEAVLMVTLWAPAAQPDPGRRAASGRQQLPSLAAVLDGLEAHGAAVRSAYGEFAYTEWQDATILTRTPRYVTSASVRWAMDGPQFAEVARLTFSDRQTRTHLRQCDGETMLAYVPMPGGAPGAETAFEAPVARAARSAQTISDFRAQGLWSPAGTLFTLVGRYDPSGRSVADGVRAAAARLVGAEDFNGLKCYRLESRRTRDDEIPGKGPIRVTTTHTWWVATNPGFGLAGRQSRQDTQHLYAHPPDYVKTSVTRFTWSGFARYGSGTWLPRQMNMRSQQTWVSGKTKELRRASLKAVSLHVNEAVPKDLLQVQLPADVRVQEVGQGSRHRLVE